MSASKSVQAVRNRSDDKGTSVAAGITSNPVDANTEALHVDGSSVTQPVSAASLPLPTGAATEATLATLATETKLELVRVLLASIDADTAAINSKLTDRSQVAQAIGDVAHDAADSGEPVKTGGTATDLAPTAVDEGDRVQASYDLEGRARNRILQESRKDANNSTTANLNSGATFTGTATAQVGYSAVHVSVYATQPLRMYFQQSTNGTDWNAGEIYYVPAVEVDTRHFQVSGGFYRLRADNTGVAATTTLNVGVVQVPTSNALPRSLSPKGSLKVTLRDDEHDKVAGFSAFGVLKTANESILADYRFSASVMADEDFLTVATTGAAGYTIPTGGQGVSLNTGASTSSKIEVASVLAPTYKAGRGQMHKLSAILGDTGVVGNVREWGVKTGNNGSYLRMDGTTLQWVIENNGVETVFNSEDWDVPITPDQYGHLFYIQFEWLGVGNYYLYYDEAVVHTYRFIGTSTDLSMGTPDLGLWLKNENTTNNTNVSLLLGCASTIMEGGTIISGIDADGVVREARVDAQGNQNVVVVGSQPPDGVPTTRIFADTPLTVGSHDTAYIIPNGDTFYLQFMSLTNEDPSKGASMEIIYYNGTEHLITRLNSAGFLVSEPFNDLSIARDGTVMVGNGTTFTIILRRLKFSGSDIAIDGFARGYVQ